jgi:DNA-binding transcriptional ArsR family regulator
MEYFIKDTGKNRIVYKSLLIDTPTSLGILANKTALDLIKELSLKPLCAMDLARRLGLHEQKVYYNIRMLEKAGIIKLLKTEERTGGTAKIYTLTEPVVSVKLAENAFMTTDTNISVKNLDLLRPFVIDGKLNAKVILGDTYSHGQYDAPAVEGSYAFDLAVLLGNYLTNLDFPYYKFDTEISKEDLEGNLILIGKFKTNIIIQKINPYLPVYFDTKTGLSIISKLTNKIYDDPRHGVIIKIDNPFNKNKKILLLGGIGRRGVQSAILAFTKYTDKLSENDGTIVRIVKGYDKNGDKIIDSIKFLE